MPEERLQKILARTGIASRRRAEQYILDGRVTVNGKTVTELGVKADPARDHIKVDGRLLRHPGSLIYLAVYKPKNCVTTVSDPQGRRTVMDLLKGVKERVYPVGRLDYRSEGLVLMTNDGELAARIMAPSTHLEKTYEVKVNGYLAREQEEKFRTGLPIYGRRTAPAGLRLLKRAPNPWYEVRLTEGRQHQIRLMFNHCGRMVEKLKRTRIGSLSLGGLKSGESRPLTAQEIKRLRQTLKLDKGNKKASRR